MPGCPISTRPARVIDLESTNLGTQGVLNQGGRTEASIFDWEEEHGIGSPFRSPMQPDSPPRHQPPRASRSAAFTLVELVVVIVVLGILGTLAVPRFIDMTAASKRAATQEGLLYLREQVHLLYLKSASTGNEPQYPTIGELRILTRGKRPENPFTPVDGNQQRLVRVVNDRSKPNVGAGGWAYNSNTGDVWANSYSGANEHTW